MSDTELISKRQEKLAELFGLLDFVDKIAKGEERTKFQGQFGYLKLAIDTRMRLMEYEHPKAPQEQKHSGEITVIVQNYGNPHTSPLSATPLPAETPSSI